jgi:hypothetical protein
VTYKVKVWQKYCGRRGIARCGRDYGDQRPRGYDVDVGCGNSIIGALVEPLGMGV